MPPGAQAAPPGVTRSTGRPPGTPHPAARPTRREVLSAAGVLGAGAALAPHSAAHATDLADPAGAGPPPVPHGATPGATPPGAGRPRRPFGTAPAADALRRLLPAHAEQFTLRAVSATGGGAEHFRVTGRTGRITVEGTSPAVQLTGVHWYLKYVCGAHLTWGGLHAGQVRLPGRLPAPGRPLARATTLPHRFALNDTNDGYTAPYADWPYWERMIDVLALHGCNEVMVIAGMEAVYHRTLQDLGYADDQARAWLPAPSHQPWWLLSNLAGYGGPLSASVIDRRAQLGRRIADRLRELGMAPVLPGYHGHVPAGFVDRHGGDARVVPQGVWHGFERPDWLDPRTTAFARVAMAFYRHQEDVFGPARHFKMDLLHEGGTAGDVPVADAARGVQRALDAAHPDATWVILGWEANPLPELLNGVERSRMLIVDGVSDRYTSVTDRERDWGGTPYAFGTIPNFGGRTTLGARTHVWAEKFFAWRDKPGSALAGTAYLPEAADRDPAAFELFTELAWAEDAPDEAARAAWFAAYADYRYGARDEGARTAWRALYDTAYQHHAVERSDPHDSLFAARPDLAAVRAARYAPPALTYDPARFDAALAGLLAVAEPLRHSAAYRYDLVDVARQALEHRSRQYLPLLKAAYERGATDTFRALARLWLTLLRLADDLAGSHPAFLLGPWVHGARQWATSAAERAAFERTAKALLTVWGGRASADDGQLHDYAGRSWHGLVADFHLPRWQRWLDALSDALSTGRAPRAVDWFAVEESWTRQRKDYPLRPVCDAFRTARRVHDVLAAAPHQGRLTVTAEPAVLPPGGQSRLTAVFTNVNGLRATGPVDLRLCGVQGRPEAAGEQDEGDQGLSAAGPRDGCSTLPAVPAAGSGRLTWRACAPAGPPSRPLSPLPYTVRVTYGPRGAHRVTDAHEGMLHVAGPLAAGWRTARTNDAVFGQLGDRFAIDGGGADLWRDTAEFGALYRTGVLMAGGRLLLAVDSQAPTAPWARAGIIVRDVLAGPGSAGFVNLAVTPAHGVVLSYDTNGDGTLDAYRALAGVTAPVLLRLTRAAAPDTVPSHTAAFDAAPSDTAVASTGAAYTGACSTDHGATWRTVGTVTLPQAGARQDAGLFMTAANGGRGARGLVEFSGWSIG